MATTGQAVAKAVANPVAEAVEVAEVAVEEVVAAIRETKIHQTTATATVTEATEAADPVVHQG